jgi:hypothetical protein
VEEEEYSRIPTIFSGALARVCSHPPLSVTSSSYCTVWDCTVVVVVVGPHAISYIPPRSSSSSSSSRSNPPSNSESRIWSYRYSLARVAVASKVSS